MNANNDLIENVLWTDESTFTRNGVLNRKTEHYYSDENPEVFFKTSNQKIFKFNVWAGLINDKIVGPYILPEILNVSNAFCP